MNKLQTYSPVSKPDQPAGMQRDDNGTWVHIDHLEEEGIHKTHRLAVLVEINKDSVKTKASAFFDKDSELPEGWRWF